MLSEKFNTQKTSFSDKKIIFNDFKNIYIKVRFPNYSALLYLIFCSLCYIFKIQNPLIFLLISAIPTYFIVLLHTKMELQKEYKFKEKLVGTFKIINKHRAKGYFTFETKFKFINVDKSSFDKVNIGESVSIEMLPNQRVLRVEKL
ncbi:MAG: hypothetical protein LCH67_18840 [Bacteroidetes bacterium]|nr:hypothetical protein [Bacteroidota bacterium]